MQKKIMLRRKEHWIFYQNRSLNLDWKKYKHISVFLLLHLKPKREKKTNRWRRWNCGEKEEQIKNKQINWLKVIHRKKKQLETCHNLGVVGDMFTFERGDFSMQEILRLGVCKIFLRLRNSRIFLINYFKSKNKK